MRSMNATAPASDGSRRAALTPDYAARKLEQYRRARIANLVLLG
jgi:hypothetical protein